MATTRNMRARTMAMSALVLACGTAMAQSGSGGARAEDQLQGSFAKPLGKGSWSPGKGGGQGSSSVVMIENRDGETFTLRIDGGTISAEHNGKAVPPDQIERKANAVIIKDKDGKTVKTFDVGVVGGGVHGTSDLSNLRMKIRGLDPSLLGVLGGAEGFAWHDAGMAGSTGRSFAMFEGDNDPPPVMVGITMSDVDSSVLEHLNLEEGSAFSVDRVVDGLPAEKGGLRPHDVVVAIDGQTPATQEKFREVLRGKKAGDHLELKIIRHGKAEKVALDLVAYDASRLGTTPVRVPGVPLEPGEGAGPSGMEGQIFQIGPFGGEANSGWTAEARRKIEDALAEIKGNPNLQPEKIKAESQRALEEALKALTETRDVFRQRWQAYRGGGAGGGAGKADVFVAPNESQPFVRMRPQGRNESGEQSVKHLERLNDQLDRLNKRLDELEKRLEKNDHR